MSCLFYEAHCWGIVKMTNILHHSDLMMISELWYDRRQLMKRHCTLWFSTLCDKKAEQLGGSKKNGKMTERCWMEGKNANRGREENERPSLREASKEGEID